jgi:hypothetical protein
MHSWFAKFAGVSLVVALVGCSAFGPTSAAAAKEQQRAKAVARATEYCKKKGLVMRPGGAEAPTRGQVPSELQFHCVKAK